MAPKTNIVFSPKARSRHLAHRLLLLALILTTFSVSHTLVIGVLGRGIPNLFTGAGYLALPVLILAWMKYREACAPAVVEMGMKLRLVLFSLAIGALAIYGLMRGNAARHVFDDTWVYVYLMFAILLGMRDEVWEDLQRPLVVLFCVSFALTLWGLSLDRGVMTASGGVVLVSDIGDDRRWIRTAGYEFSRVLGFWPLVVMMHYFRRGSARSQAIGIAVIVAFLCLQVVFQKRAPFVRTILYAAVLVLFPLINRRRASLAGAMAVVAAIALTIFAASTTDVFRQLMSRYVSDDPVVESSRLLEARALLADLTWPEYIFGRGMGGYFYPPEDWDAGNVEVAPGVLARLALHVGILVPLLKGGIVYWAIVYSFFLSAFRPRSGEWYSNRFNMCALAILPVYIASQVIEGAPGIPNIFEALIIGLAAGRLGLVARVHPRSRLPRSAPTSRPLLRGAM